MMAPPKSQGMLVRPGVLGRINNAKGGEADGFPPDLMSKDLGFGRDNTGNGPVANENSFADPQEHELYGFHQLVVGELAIEEVSEEVSDIWRAVTIREAAFVVGSEIAVVVSFGDPASFDVIHGSVGAELRGNTSVDATQERDPMGVVP